METEVIFDNDVNKLSIVDTSDGRFEFFLEEDLCPHGKRIATAYDLTAEDLLSIAKRLQEAAAK